MKLPCIEFFDSRSRVRQRPAGCAKKIQSTRKEVPARVLAHQEIAGIRERNIAGRHRSAPIAIGNLSIDTNVDAAGIRGCPVDLGENMVPSPVVGNGGACSKTELSTIPPECQSGPPLAVHRQRVASFSYLGNDDTVPVTRGCP